MAAEIFGVLSTQLKVGGLGGVFGFDYAALPFIFRLFDVPESEWLDTFERLSVLCAEALKVWKPEKKN